MLVQQILKSKGDDGVVTVAARHHGGRGGASCCPRAGSGRSSSRATASASTGILSERDIVRELGRRGAGLPGRHGGQPDDGEDRLLHPRRPATDAVLQKMTDGRFRHMPVMEGDEMVGLISIGDVVKARLMELAAEKDALEGMIKGF